MNILVSGSHGLIGSALVPCLAAAGHRITRLVRRGPIPHDAVMWNPMTGAIEASQLGPIDAVIHLAGESIAAGRWTAARKAAIRDSRVHPTRQLCDTISRWPAAPHTLICASAIGYYGTRGDEHLTEQSSAGTGFLPEVCQAWEAATAPAVQRGIRVVNVRTGIVLSRRGGALGKMLPMFRVGLGGPLGSGHQIMSWIALDDVVGAIAHALIDERLRGPVNAVAPAPVTNREFTRLLGRFLARPACIPAPRIILRLILGQLADEALLASAHVVPEQLLASGYRFRYPTLEGALHHVLAVPKGTSAKIV